jgi:predicted Zn-dependent peptidase
MLDRTLAPGLKEMDEISFLTPQQFDISEHSKLYFIKEVQNETARLDLHFDAGNMHGNEGIASLVNGLLLSGTDKWSSTEIHSKIDSLGGFYESGIVNEGSVISIYCLRENLMAILDIVHDAMNNVAFLPKEIDELISDRKQKLQVSFEKVGVLAQRAFQQRMFSGTSYGRIVQLHTFDQIERGELVRFHQDHYLAGLTRVVVVGNIHQDDIDRIIDITGKWATNSTPTFHSSFQNLRGAVYEVKEGALQTAIRVGRTLFNKKHADMHDFLVLNTILGDYFGSRLMSNIREDKGYTYGIGSGVAEMNESGYFYIVTEVGKEVRDAAMSEIRKELERLQEELIPLEELNLVKKYMVGQLLKSADGPYAAMDLYLGVEPMGLSFDYYNEHITAIKKVTPERLRDLARTYLRWEDMTVVSAG